MFKNFTHEDQVKFARASGDFNPIHMDEIAARRTQAGAPIVHGIHTLLWLIDTLAAQNSSLPRLSSLQIKFSGMVYIGNNVEAKILDRDDKTLQAGAFVNGNAVVKINGVFGEPLPRQPRSIPNDTLITPTIPLDLPFEDMNRFSGLTRLPDSPELDAIFPNAARYLGKRRIAALAGTSYVTGMIVPGLHSMYAGIRCDICEDDQSIDNLSFQVTLADERVRLVKQNIEGGGISAKLDTFARTPPVKQASIEDVATRMCPNEFSGQTALIVGGSRGLGELTAKIIIAGGGKAIITYTRGKEDAEKLAATLNAWGGNCTNVFYDALGETSKQLKALETPSHLYYYATPPVLPSKSTDFNRPLYDTYEKFYVGGFEKLVTALSAASHDQHSIGIFYPSSCFVDDPPKGFSEYAKAKEAGEKICAEIANKKPNIKTLAPRLPRMLTDLTASLFPVETANPLEILLPLVRQTQNLK